MPSLLLTMIDYLLLWNTLIPTICCSLSGKHLFTIYHHIPWKILWGSQPNVLGDSRCIGQSPSISKSNRLHIVIFWYFFNTEV